LLQFRKAPEPSIPYIFYTIPNNTATAEFHGSKIISEIMKIALDMIG
jgi:hypothetical protein